MCSQEADVAISRKTSDGARLVASHWLLHLPSPQGVVPSAAQGSCVQFKRRKEDVLLLYKCIRAVHGSQRDSARELSKHARLQAATARAVLGITTSIRSSP